MTEEQTINKRIYEFGYRHFRMPWELGPRQELVGLVESGRIAPIMAISTEWGDVLDITVVPAVTAEEGLELAKQMMAE